MRKKGTNPMQVRFLNGDGTVSDDIEDKAEGFDLCGDPAEV